MTDTCPTCGAELKPGTSDGRNVLACVPCQYLRDVDARPVALKLPGMDRGKQSRQVKEQEKRLVEDIRTSLQRAGYLVLRVGQWRADKAGNDVGCPDLLVSFEGWPACWLALEVKTTTGKARLMQAHFIKLGAVVMVRSVSEGMAIAEATRARLEGLVRG